MSHVTRRSEVKKMKRRGKLMVELAKKIHSPPPNAGLPAVNDNPTIADDPKSDQGVATSDMTVTVPAEEDINRHVPDNLDQDEQYLPFAKDAFPLLLEVDHEPLPIFAIEEIDKQAVEIPLFSSNKEELPSRPGREQKTRGREKVLDILNQTDDTINDPLFSSDDSDNYLPSSSSSDEESSFSKRIKVYPAPPVNNLQQQPDQHQKPAPRTENNQKGQKGENVKGFHLIDDIFSSDDPDDPDLPSSNSSDEESRFSKRNEVHLAPPVNNLQQQSDQRPAPRTENNQKRRKGENVNPKDWERNVSAAKRRRGEPYFGLKKQHNEDGPKYKFNNGRKGKEVKDRCSCKNGKNFKCEKITDLDRKQLFTNFWKNIDSWEAKRAVVVSLVDKSAPIWRRGDTDIENARKNVSFQYHLKSGDEKIRVCKKMFLNTFCLGEKSVRSWVLKGILNHPVPPENNPDDPLPLNEIAVNSNTGQSEKDTVNREGIRQFLISLSKMESHYCRARTSKEYLEPNWESKSQLYREYSRLCLERNTEPASRALFHNIFITMNLGFFTPKKDQCETCIKHKLGKISKDEFQNHIKRKEESRKEKDSDKKISEEKKKTLVVAVDVQKVLICPDMRASSAYYKTKLKVHNYSIYNLANHDVICYVWHEGNGQLDSDVFASMLERYLNKQKELNPDINEVIIWSDGCTYQNRCETVANALLYFSIRNNVTVYQKYLEVGHTQMEVDSVHSTIERKIKKREHYVPADYVRDIKEARREARPYHVETLTYKDFSNFSDGYYKSIRPGIKKGDPYVTDLRCLKYTSDGHISYKLDFAEEWQLLPRRPKLATQVYSELKPLYNKQVPITARKFKDLQELRKPFGRRLSFLLQQFMS